MADDDFSRWMDSLSGEGQGAGGKLWEEYFRRLVGYARRKLQGISRRAIDEEDVALSAMVSFWKGIEAGRFKVSDREDLWKLLVTITARKACAARRHFYAQKEGGGQLRGDSVMMRADRDSGCGPGEVLGPQPSPELVAMVLENCEVLLDRLGDETLRQVALLTLEGYSPNEIATKQNCVRRTIERKLERIRTIWSRANAGDAARD